MTSRILFLLTGGTLMMREGRLGKALAPDLSSRNLVAEVPVLGRIARIASRSLRGARAMKRDAWALDAFDSPSCAPLVELGVGVDVAPHVRAAGKLRALDVRLEPRVLAVRVFPGLDPALVRGALGVGVRGLVLEAYGTGNLPHLDGSLIGAIEDARA